VWRGLVTFKRRVMEGGIGEKREQVKFPRNQVLCLSGEITPASPKREAGGLQLSGRPDA
jgi:hypothetical protein